MTDSDSHAEPEHSDVGSGADYNPLRQQQGRVPLDEDPNRDRDVRHRERAVSGSEFQELAPSGFPKTGRAAAAAVFAVAGLALGALPPTQIQGRRDLRPAGAIDRDKLVGAARTTPQQDETAAPSTATGEPESKPLPPTVAPIEINFNALA